MPPNTQKKIVRARRALLLFRICALLGALGSLFCVITINKTASTVGWIIRVAPAIATVHTVYGVYHLCRDATGRTPASTASYMIFAAMVDTGLIPFFVFSAWMAHADYTQNTYGWSTLFNDSDLSYKIIQAFFLLSCIGGGFMVLSLILDVYLAVKFRQIARLPPDMNPLEPNFTSRHKRNKSEFITEKNMKASELAARRDSQNTTGFRRIPFIHTRTDSADSVTLYGSDSARASRAEFRKELDDSGSDPWRWSGASSPERPSSAVNPSPTSRTAGAGLDFRPERSSNLTKEVSRPSSWLSYLDYEGMPSTLSDDAAAELDHEVRPISPISAMSTRDAPVDNKMQYERENWYQGAGRDNQMHAPVNGGSSLYLMNSPSKTSLRQGLSVPSPELSAKRRSREPLSMNPPTPNQALYNDENMYATPTRDGRVSNDLHRAALHESDANALGRASIGSRPASFVGSGGKARFYGNLRSSFGSANGAHDDKKNATVMVSELQVQAQQDHDAYERTRTLQTESDYSGNFEIHSSSDEDEAPSANIVKVPTSLSSHPHQWNGARQASNSTGYDLNGGYAGLGSEFGRGMGRRRDVSGKVVEEGRAPPPKHGAAGWERFKGL